MLIQFSVMNFLSFKNMTTLSLAASNLQDSDVGVMTAANLRMLKAAAIYGANASGKSNLLKALAWMTRWMRQSSKESQAGDPIDVQPYALNPVSADQPSFFEIIMLIDEVRYRYGFEVDRERVVKEWLYRTPKQRERKLYERDGQNFSISGQFVEGNGLADRTRPNSLFLSVAAQFNGEIAGRIMEWVGRVRSVGADPFYRNVSSRLLSTRLLSEEQFGARISELIKSVDLGIERVFVEEESFPVSEEDSSDLPSHSRLNRTYFVVRTAHLVYDEEGKAVGEEIFDLHRAESSGTLKIFELTGPIMLTLTQGGILLVDELDSRLHPLLTRYLIRLFHENNVHGAQFIFGTHSSEVLEEQDLRRDEIWLMEKDRFGASSLFSVAEFKPRKSASLRKDYLFGRFGAVPVLTPFEDGADQ